MSSMVVIILLLFFVVLGWTVCEGYRSKYLNYSHNICGLVTIWYWLRRVDEWDDGVAGVRMIHEVYVTGNIDNG